LNTLGVSAGIVHGEMPSEKRARALDDFRNGRVQVLTNVAVLTEGFDDPGTSCIAMARPTRSEGLYAQCVGRGTRLHPEKKDCLILDFVDLSTLSLCSLPSLFGIPRNLNLDGGDAVAARRAWLDILEDQPGFELEAGALTHPEIQNRAAAFNPLTLEVHEDVRAISGNAWFSLGRHGLGLHFQKATGKISEVVILRKLGRGKVWEVLIDDKPMERFSQIEDAVSAVDYEIEQFGPKASQSALPTAPWRLDNAEKDGGNESRQRALWDRVIRRP
ncbi:MAG: helicase-related protein, partial [Verrucomicrobiota bacterium]